MLPSKPPSVELAKMEHPADSCKDEGMKGNETEDAEQKRRVGQASQRSDSSCSSVRVLAYLVGAKITLNPHTQNRRMRHANSLHERVGHSPKPCALNICSPTTKVFNPSILQQTPY